MIRQTVVLLLFLASCARPAALDPSTAIQPLDPVDKYILQHLFIGSPDALSPIGGKGKPIRGEGEHWTLIPVWRGRQLESESQRAAYVQHTWCYSGQKGSRRSPVRHTHQEISSLAPYARAS